MLRRVVEYDLEVVRWLLDQRNGDCWLARKDDLRWGEDFEAILLL